MTGATVTAARAAADQAAARSGVRIRVARTLAEVQVARRVIDEVWNQQPTDPGEFEPLLWAMAHVGNYCAVAYDTSDDDGSSDDGSGLPIGVCIGFLGLHPERSLHSHAAGVTRAGAGRNIGFALKLDQRAWALDHGLDTMTWTYDPLIRRNAFFNLTRLGARPVEYLPDFYGEMTDAINSGQGSDRVMLVWDLASPEVARCATRSGPEPASYGDRKPLSDKVVRYVQVPPDIERMRAEDPEQARQWRQDVRRELGGLMADGWSVRSMSRDGYYELRSNQ